LHSLSLQFGNRLIEFLGRRLREPVEVDVADPRLDNVSRIDAVDGDLVPRDRIVDKVLLPPAVNGNRHFRSALATQVVEHELVRNVLPDHKLPVDPDDLVARHDAEFLGRPPRGRMNHRDRISQDLELDAHPVKISFQRFIGPLQVLLRNIDGVRVQFLKGFHNGRFHQLRFIHGIHVSIPDDLEGHVVFLHPGVGIDFLGLSENILDGSAERGYDYPSRQETEINAIHIYMFI
jgi:hypothetical protein